MPSTNKLIGIALTGTGIVGAGAGTYYAFGSNSQTSEKTPAPVIKSKINDLITVSKRTVLTETATSDDWGIKLDVYNKSIKKLKKITLTTENEAGLKEWCSETTKKDIEISKKDEENSDFKIALKLCTKPTNKEKIEKAGKKTIAGKGDWGAIKTKYAEASNTDNIITSIDKAKVTESQIEEWCSETLEKEIVEVEHKLADEWCTKQPAS